MLFRSSRTTLSNHNAKIPFEDDSVHGLLVDNIDLTKTIERYHTGQHMVTDEHTGVLYREGTVVAEPASCKTPPKVGGKVVDLISCGCITPTEITKDGPVMCMCGGASCNGADGFSTAQYVTAIDTQQDHMYRTESCKSCFILSQAASCSLDHIELKSASFIVSSVNFALYSDSMGIYRAKYCTMPIKH